MKNVLFVALLILAVISVVLTGCGNPSTPAPATTAPAQTTAATATTAPKTTTPAASVPATTAAPTTTAPVKVTTWRFATHIAASNESMSPVMRAYAANVEKATGGRLKMQFFWSGSLAPVNGAFEAVQTGLCDIAQVDLGLYVAQLPLTQSMALPGISPPRADQFGAGWDMAYEKSPDLQAEYDKWNTVYAFSIHSPLKNIGGKFPVKTVDDLKGKKVRVQANVEGQLLKVFGAVPMVMGSGDVYTSLSSGLLDLVLHDRSAFTSFRWAEVSKYYTDGISLNASTALFLINKNSWNALPKDIQDILISLRPATNYLDYYWWNTPTVTNAFDAAFKNIQISTLPESERAKLIAAAPAVLDGWITQSGGDKAKKWLDTLQAAFKDAVTKYPKGVPGADIITTDSK